MSKRGSIATASPEDTKVVKLGEKVGYSSYFIGQNIIYALVSTYISTYFVMKLGIPAAIVGVILLAARVWDAVNDPIFSVIVEKVKLKGGKFKPWINAVVILMPISTVLIFSFTEALVGSSMTFKIIYASVTYVIWDMLYTVSDAPAFALATVMSPNPAERNTLMSVSKTLAFFGVLLGTVAVMPIVGMSSWFIMAAILSAISLFTMLPIRACKERVESTQEKSPPVRDILRAIFSNKFLVITVICMVFKAGLNFTQTITTMLAADIFGDADLSSLLMLIVILPMMLAMPFTPMLIKKFGKIKLYIYSSIVTVVFSVGKFFLGYDSFLMFAGISVVQGILTGFSMILPTLFFADCIEYYFCKTGTRFEAATFAAQTFANKALAAVAGAGSMWILAAYGYKEAIDGVAQIQSQRALDGIWLAYNIGPAVGSIIALIIFWIAYDLSEAKLSEMKKNVGQ